MGPVTRSAAKLKPEEVSKQTSPKAIKSKKQVKKPAAKKTNKNVETDKNEDPLKVENGAAQETVEEESKDAKEQAVPKGSKRKVDNKKSTETKKSTKSSSKKQKVENGGNDEKLSEVTEEVAEETPEETVTDAKTIYEFSVKDIDGNEVSLEKYKGHVCIIVNVASRCGHTKSNYEQFVELYNKHSEENGLRILAFPCNQFGSQEAGTCEKIKAFAENKGVQFDMFDKIDVNGKNASPLWTFLKEKLPEVTSGKDTGKNIKWNFTKFIVNKEGVPVERYPSATKPSTLLESLEKLW